MSWYKNKPTAEYKILTKTKYNRIQIQTNTKIQSKYRNYKKKTNDRRIQ